MGFKHVLFTDTLLCVAVDKADISMVNSMYCVSRH
jgi:hypothetical protein